MNGIKGTIAALIAGTALHAGAASAQTEQPQVMLIMDSSGSMKKRIGALSKIEIAKASVADFVASAPGDVPLGLMAYGHRRAKDCTDIEVMIPPTEGSGARISNVVNAMRPRGETPIAESLRQAADYMNSSTRTATVVLVTDGEEACNADPCAAARELEASGVEFTAHVIGFGLNEEQSQAVKCLADETGGQFIAADDAVTLASALRRVVPAKPEPVPRGEGGGEHGVVRRVRRRQAGRGLVGAQRGRRQLHCRRRHPDLDQPQAARGCDLQDRAQHVRRHDRPAGRRLGPFDQRQVRVHHRPRRLHLRPGRRRGAKPSIRRSPPT